MKLYATTTSERASKGQGGNDYLCIKLTVHNGSRQDYPIGEIILDYMDDSKKHGTNQNEWVLKWLSQDDYEPKIVAQGNIEPPTIKGKKQTSERCTACGKNRMLTSDKVCHDCARIAHEDGISL